MSKIEKILIFGSNGMLGSYIHKYFFLSDKYTIIPIIRSDFDAYTDGLKKLNSLFIENKVNQNTLVFNAIGIIPQKQDNNNSHIYIKVNSIFPHLLSFLCEQYKCKLIHASTDCVFSGESGLYIESDKCDGKNIYALSKICGDLFEYGTIIRTSIIGESKSQYGLLEWVKSKKGKEIQGYSNHFWNGITCLQYAKIVEEIIERDMFWNGVKHICCPTTLSKNELCSLINQIYDLNIKIISNNKGLTINKSLSTIYSDFIIPDIKSQLEELFLFKL